MSAGARARNRRKQRNDLRLPVILFFVIVGSLVGGRWMREMRVNHEIHRLSAEAHKSDLQITELRRDIKDLQGRFSALITRDAALQMLSERGVTMQKIQSSSVITLDVSNVGMNVSPGGSAN